MNEAGSRAENEDHEMIEQETKSPGSLTDNYEEDIGNGRKESSIMSSASPLFILSVSRSFTSVTCAMIGQHPQMYGLPELHPFVASTIGGRGRFQTQRRHNVNGGLLRVIAELFFGAQTAETVELARGWLNRRWAFSPCYVMEQIAERVSPRILVDKSPSTSSSIAYLNRAGRMFPDARFIHLVRHPRSRSESVVAVRIERRCKRRGIDSTSVDKRLFRIKANLPEQWLYTNRNILRFLSQIPAERQRRVRGEDLLSHPDTQLREIAAWLGLRTDTEAVNAMKHPENSPYACIGPPGAKGGNDRIFLENPALRPLPNRPSKLPGLSWNRDEGGFSKGVRQLARRFGYE